MTSLDPTSVFLHAVDPVIRPLVKLLNQLPGVVTRFSCAAVGPRLDWDTGGRHVHHEHEGEEAEGGPGKRCSSAA